MSEDKKEISVMKVDYTVREGLDGTEKPVIHIFGRDSNEELEHVKIHGFEPYFYAPTREVRNTDLSNSSIKKTQKGHKGMRGKDLTKITTYIPKQVGYIREDFEDTYEADVLFPNRFLIDKGIKSGIRVPEDRDKNGTINCHESKVEAVDMREEPRINVFDIEVDDRSGFPEDGEEEIIAITSWDSYIEEYIVWVYHPESEQKADDVFPSIQERGDGQWIYTPNDDELFPDYDPIDDEEIQYRVAMFNTEEDMLANFLDYIENTDPDCITGWNFDDFDAPYMIDRLEKLNNKTSQKEDRLDPERLSRLNEVWTSDWGGPTIKGRVVFDLLEGYKRTKFSEMESYRLDAIGEIELGIGKEVHDGKVGDLWTDDFHRLLEYNLRDVELCVELNEQQSIIAFWNEVRSFVGCQLEDAPIPSDACDQYVLHKTVGTFALPSKGQNAAEHYEGGAVFEPISGVRENVNVLDLKSLYPMCMVTINASPETKVDPEEYDGETYEAPTGVHFKKEEDGIIREMVEELLAEREKKKELRNQHKPGSQEYQKFDRQQGSVKVIMNSLYGVLGWERFRLYDKEMGAAVTATGRSVIQFTEEISNDLGYDVVYGDTDSVMLEMGQIPIDEIENVTDSLKEEHPELITDGGELQVSEELREKYSEYSEEELEMLVGTIAKGFEIEEKINEGYDRFAKEKLNADEHRFLIESEKLYRRFFQAGKKKRYGGHIIWTEGKFVDDIDITGFEAERSDVAGITEEVQTKVIEMISYGADKEEIKEYVHSIVQKFENEELSLEHIGIPSGIGKSLHNYETATAQVRGSMYANTLLGLNLGKGSKPKRVYLTKIHPDFYDRFEADFDTSREQEIYNEFRREHDVICFEYDSQVPDEFQPDWEKMLNKTVKKPMEKIINAIGISWDEVKTNQTQTGLESFV